MKILTMILIGFVAWYVLQVIADWKIFSKAGKPGILAFIPIVNVFTEYSICWSSVMGVVYLICVGVTSYVNGVQEPSSTLAAVAGVAGLVGTVLHIMQSIKLAKSFGKGVGYGIFLIILGPLARVILGLGDSEYIGQY